jgi:hypothetical protein
MWFGSLTAMALAASQPGGSGPYDQALQQFKASWMQECERHGHSPTPPRARELHLLCTCTLREASATLTGQDGPDTANRKIHAAMTKCDVSVHRQLKAEHGARQD